MSRYRLLPTPAQEAVLRGHCAHARFVWNLAVEQHAHWRPGRAGAPGYLEQCRQLSAARAEHPWLAAGSQTVQQQALRDFAQAMAAFFDPANPARRPTWRKAGRDEGFRIVGRGRQWDLRRLSRKTGEVWVPKAGWVRFRWSRPVPPDAKSFRVTMDQAGRWHVAFVSVPEPIPAPGNGEVVGIDRGVTVSAALSTGDLLTVPGLTARERTRLRRLERKLARARRGSNRRAQVKHAIARLRARETDRRKDWAEKTSTAIARRFHLIRVEDLKIRNMTRSAKGTAASPGRNVRGKAGLNRGILRSGWGLLVRRLDDKAPGRVEKVTPAFTSQRCSACGHVDGRSRESQARFACTACGYAGHADVNAARNIAAGHAMTARGGFRDAGPVNREPHLLASLTDVSSWNPPPSGGGGCQVPPRQPCHASAILSVLPRYPTFRACRTGTMAMPTAGIAAPFPVQLRAGAHTDYGTLTILRQDAVGGLEVLDPGGTWAAVESVPGAFVINIGDLMAQMPGRSKSRSRPVISS
jgi:putative transposase